MNILFYLLLFTFLATDTVQFFYLGKPFFCCLLAWWSILLCSENIGIALTNTIILLSLESWIFYHHVGLCLLYLAPLTLVTVHLFHFLYHRIIYACIINASALILNTLIIEHMVIGDGQGFNFTLVKIFANIGIVVLLNYLIVFFDIHKLRIK